jgi:hypothetical protein
MSAGRLIPYASLGTTKRMYINYLSAARKMYKYQTFSYLVWIVLKAPQSHKGTCNQGSVPVHPICRGCLKCDQ